MPIPSPQASALAVLWVLFGHRGRVSRQTYWLGFGLLMAINSVVVAQIVGGEQASYHRPALAAFPVVAFATVGCNIMIGIKRLHDFDANGLWALALLLPFVNVAFTIWAGIVPGTAAPNRYGSAPDVPS